ncbi:MAG TPA: DUF3775 domain-containing protein [Caulobacterales bacterium]|nr:DUF3775 domain-containing protein [Caulobacterales bacterium]
MVEDPFPDPVELPLSTDQLAFIVLKARAYDAEVEIDDPDEGSNAADDRSIDALEGSPDNPTARELSAAIRSFNEEEQAALVALAWLGRDDFEAEEWNDALAEARARSEGPAWRYLMGMPLLGDLLEDGAAKLGVNLTSDEQIALHHPITERPAEDDRD